MARIVVALGGNALGSTLPEQAAAVKVTARAVVDLIEDGHQVVVAHGNGPQVGIIHNAMAALQKEDPTQGPTPLSVCGAMSQAYIGYDLQNAFREELLDRGIRSMPVCSIVTQVEVDPADPAFREPTKPIGPFYSKEEAKTLAREKGYTVKEDSGRGWRRVVPSPKPRRIVEIGTIRTLWDTTITIACGGGGIPVVERDGVLEGVAAVIDKDLAADRLAEEMGADILMILTEVPAVAIRFNQPDQQNLGAVTTSTLEQYARDGEFGAGSMLPKVQAAVAFAKSGPGRKSIITSLDRGVGALAGRCGTLVTPD